MRLLFLCKPRHPGSIELADESVAAWTDQTIQNLRTIVEESGRSLADIVKTTVSLVDMDEDNDLDEVCGASFHEHPPARVCIEAERLPTDIHVEIEVMAYVE